MTRKLAAGLARGIKAVQRRLGMEVNRIVYMALADAGDVYSRRADIECREITEAEALACAADPALELCAPGIGAAYARGDLCVGAFCQGRLVGYQWVAFGPTPDVGGVWVRFAPQTFYVYKRFVLAAFRGQRIAATLQQEANALARGRGCSGGVAFVSVHNAASWRAGRRDGAHTVGFAGYVRLGHFFLALRTPGAKRKGFEFYQPGKAQLAAELAHLGHVLWTWARYWRPLRA